MTRIARPTRLFKTALLAGALVAAGACWSAPVLSQAGNLLVNGNFETGFAGTATGIGSSALGSWQQYANTSPVSSQWASAPVVDGDHSAFVTGNLNDGLYQYQGLAGGTYTLSGWVYVLTGTVKLGVAWNSGSNSAFSAAQGPTGAWEYLSVTQTINASTGGALVYGAGAGGSYYVDGLWLNAGSTSTSVYAPGRGFNPNAVVAGLPEPGSLALAGLGLLALARRRPRLQR